APPRLDPGSGVPVAGSLAIETMRAPVQEPAAPCVATSALPAHGAGHDAGAKARPKETSWIWNEASSAGTVEQSFPVGTPGALTPWARQQGWPQSSPLRTGIIRSRPPASAL